MTNIGNRIKKRREELGLTQEDLALKLGYKSKSTINKVELGINDISQAKILSYANALNTTPAYLMGWDAQEPASPEPNTLAAHFEGEEFTDEELEEIANFVKFVKAKRNN